MPSVLFICTANQFRSPLAAACLRNVIELEKPAGPWRVESAGTWATAGLQAPELTLRVARKLGLRGLETHRTRQVDRELLSAFDLIIVMESGHKEAICQEFPAVRARTFMLSEILDGIAYDIPDPALAPEETYSISREIKTLIDRHASKIFKLAGTLCAPA
jgi:protein-tyrosine-phosphatase